MGLFLGPTSSDVPRKGDSLWGRGFCYFKLKEILDSDDLDKNNLVAKILTLSQLSIFLFEPRIL